MMDYVLLYPKREELGFRGEVTDVDYPFEAEQGSIVYVRATMLSKQPIGTPLVETQFLFRLLDAITREELSFRGWFTVYPGTIHRETLTFTMPSESINLELELRYKHDPMDPHGIVEDTYRFSISVPMAKLTVRSSPITGVPVKVDGVEQATPAYYEVSKGPYRVIVPSRYEERDFERWENDSTDPLRHINIIGDADITAYYEAVAVEEELWYEKYQKELIIGGAIFIGLLILTS